MEQISKAQDRHQLEILTTKLPVAIVFSGTPNCTKTKTQSKHFILDFKSLQDIW